VVVKSISKLKQYIKVKWRDPVCKMYREFGSGVFTSQQVLQVASLTHGERAGMFHSLRDGGIITLANGLKRGYYNRYSDGIKSSPWQFSQRFIEYMEDGGLAEMEA
jgi:hypothetical protein